MTASGAVSALPLSQMFSWGPITVEGRTPQPGEGFLNADQRIVSGRYFEAMEIPLLSGRLFNEHDTRDSGRVAIVDEFMAQQLWPDQDAVGRRLRTGTSADGPWMTVVGVVGRVKQYTLDTDSRIAMYFAHAQYPTRAMNVVLRGRADPDALTAEVRRELREVDPDLPMYGVRTMAERVDESLARRRFSMLLLTLFAALALGLASIGTYGVLAYLVSQGTREIGIRLALGATPRRILVLIVRHGMSVALAGVALGVAGAFLLTRFMRTLLFGVTASDPLTFAAIAGAADAGRPVRELPPRAPRRADRSDGVAAERIGSAGFHWVPRGSAGFRRFNGVLRGSRVLRFRGSTRFFEGSAARRRSARNARTQNPEPSGTRWNRTLWNPVEPCGTP